MGDDVSIKPIEVNDNHVNLESDFLRWRQIELDGQYPSEEWQEDVWQQTVGSSTVENFPVDREYEMRFCKKIVALCEEKGEEVSEQWYQRLAELFSDSSARPAYRTYMLGKMHTKVSIRESRMAISGGTTGLCSWPAGEALASWVDGEGNNWEGKRVLELGSGSGISGIFIAKRWRSNLEEIVLTDCHDEVLSNLRHNVEVNLDKGGVKVRVEELDWESISESSFQMKPDILLGADIVFDGRVIPSLVSTIHLLLSSSSKAHIACTVRNQDTLDLFLSECRRKELRVEEEPLEAPTSGLPPIIIIHLSKPP